jgi:hypothetical protein
MAIGCLHGWLLQEQPRESDDVEAPLRRETRCVAPGKIVECKSLPSETQQASDCRISGHGHSWTNLGGWSTSLSSSSGGGTRLSRRSSKLKLLGRRVGMMRWPPPVLGTVQPYSWCHPRHPSTSALALARVRLFLALNGMIKIPNADYTLIKGCNDATNAYILFPTSLQSGSK